VWFTYIADANLTYLAFNRYPAADEFNHIAASLFQTLDEHPGGALAIDFRNNGGGDYIEFDHILLDGLKSRDWLSERGRLFALIGRKTFSAAMMNALQLRQQMHAILVGEPTGARPNSYSEAGHFTLPNSHFEVQYSRLYYHLVPGNPDGVIPDKSLPPAWEDYRAGKDSALAWVLNTVKRKHDSRPSRTPPLLPRRKPRPSASSIESSAAIRSRDHQARRAPWVRKTRRGLQI
jgi:hypothetical protein